MEAIIGAPNIDIVRASQQIKDDGVNGVEMQDCDGNALVGEFDPNGADGLETFEEQFGGRLFDFSVFVSGHQIGKCFSLLFERLSAPILNDGDELQGEDDNV